MEAGFNIEELRKRYDALPKKIKYGTAGFRGAAADLDYVTYF
jgi:hypothetical protein